MTSEWRRALILLVFSLFVVFIYSFRIANIPLVKVDEFWGANASAAIAKQHKFALPGLAGQLQESRKTFFHPPLFYLLQAPFISVLGTTPTSVRILPTLCALGSFLLLFIVLQRSGTIRSQTLWPIVGVAIVAFNPLCFVLARHSRPETMIMFLATATVFVFLDVLIPTNNPTSTSRFRIRTLVAGFLSGLAMDCLFWAWFLPGTIALLLVIRRRWNTLMYYAIGTAVALLPVAIWIYHDYPTFVAQTRWIHGGVMSLNPLTYLQYRIRGVLENWFSLRTIGVWLVAMSSFLLELMALLQARRKDRVCHQTTIAAAGMIILFLFLFPRQSAYYLIAVVFFLGAVIPFQLHHLMVNSSTKKARLIQSLGSLIIAGVVLVEMAGIAAIFVRDFNADYHRTFAPFAEAMDRLDPGKTRSVVGPSISYLAFSHRPFLVDWNPSLWQPPMIPISERGQDIEDRIARWRSLGIRFLLLGTPTDHNTEAKHVLYPPEYFKVSAYVVTNYQPVLRRPTTHYLGELDSHQRGFLLLYDLTVTPTARP